jgi:hypothetical protein
VGLYGPCTATHSGLLCLNYTIAKAYFSEMEEYKKNGLDNKDLVSGSTSDLEINKSNR